jgi:hypothetical protein
LGPITETRSRDEWLAEVKRRGGRLRRRRQLTMALVGALALVVPMSALTTLLVRDSDPDVSQLVAGPGLTTSPGEIAPSAGIEAGSAGELPSLPIAPATTTTVKPAPSAAVTSLTDDPVVRPAPTTTVPSGNGITTFQSAAPTTTTIAPAALAPCVASEFKLTVSMEKTAYKPGETVSSSSVLEKLSPGRCLLPSWSIEVSFLNSAGKDVGQIARTTRSYQTDDQHKKWDEVCGQNSCPRWVESGAVFTHEFDWETVDCTTLPTGPIVPPPGDMSYCKPFPAGTYTVLAYWSGPGSGPSASETVKLSA